MNKERSYTTQTYDAVKASLYALPAIVLIIVFVMVIARLIHSEAFAVTGWVLACSVPFLFQKRYKALFTRHVELDFDQQGFVFKEYTIKNNAFLRELSITWDQINSYRCSFSSSNMTYLVLHFKNGTSKRFSFKDEKSQEQAINGKSVFTIFNYYIGKYNSNKQIESKITLRPGFLTTRSGTLVLYGLSFLSVIAIVIHFVLAPQTFMLSFMSFFILLGLLIKRKNDKVLYNKISQLEPQPPVD